MSAPLYKAGPIAYCLSSVIVYGLMINCGEKPTLSRISSKCRSAEASNQSDAKKTATGTNTNKKSAKAASLTSSQDVHSINPVAEEAYQLSEIEGEDDAYQENGSLGLADDAETFYNSNVKSIIEGKCANCHPSVSQPPLNSYSKVKEVSNDVLRTMKSTDPRVVMPPGGSLPEAEIAKVAEWVKLLSAPTSGGSTSTSTNKATNTAPRIGSSTKTSNAIKDECKASNGTPGTSTASTTAKSTSTKSGTGTSTGKK